MNERIKQIRSAAKLTQADFAERIGLSRNYIAQVEMGIRDLSDRAIRDICREFNINEEWLRTGDGDMKTENSTAAEISEAVRRVLSDKPESFQSALITVLMRFEEEGNQWHVLEEIFDRVTAEMKRRNAEYAKKP